jgi:hypothetical protein
MAADASFAKLVAVAGRLSMRNVFDEGYEVSDFDADEYLATNAEALAAARQALVEPCAVVLANREGYLGDYIEQCYGLLDLGRSFCLAARRAEDGGELNEAIGFAVAALDVANAMRRGGLVVGMLVALNVESMAIARLRRIHRRLDAGDGLRLAAELLRIDDQREAFDVIQTRDNAWEQKQRAIEPAADDVDFMTMEWPKELTASMDADEEQFIRQSMQGIADLPTGEYQALKRRMDHRELALLRLLTIETALVAYFRSREKHAAALGDLAPKMIPRLPVDPFSGGAFRYSVTDGECLLYSPGPSGIDHGGVFGCWADVEAGRADLCLAMADFACGGNIGSESE